LDTGLRPAEALGLKWSDLDLDSGVIRVQRALKEPRGEGDTWRLERPKTKTAVRSVHIMPDTLKALRQHRKRQVEERLAAEDWGANTEPNMIFTTSTGTYPRQANLHRRHFKPTLKAAGLPDMRIYDLRHSAASILLALGENPKVVQERLGHRDVGLTLNTYSHLVEGMQEQATARMAQALAGA
jgi:integrase